MTSKLFKEYVKTRSAVRREWLTFMGFAIASLLLLTITINVRTTDLNEHDRTDWQNHFRWKRRSLMQVNDPTTTTVATSTEEQMPEKCKKLIKGNDSNSMFLPDLIPIEYRRHGAIILHIFGLLYMFGALAIVCDEFFVPALGVITEKLQLSDDVAGATFMAAGGSAPEFFTSVIGVFVAQDNVGIGTIVGSATFNILCVLAFCCLFSKGVLHLTWWPLFRDVSFYILALALVVASFLDEVIMWYEALILFMVYVAYIMFMKYNEELEIWVKTRILGHSVQVLSSEAEVPSAIGPPPTVGGPPVGVGPATDGGVSSRPSTGSQRRRSSIAGRRQSIPILHSGAMFRNGIVQLMVHTLDPLSELHVDDKLVQLQGMASVKVILDRSALPHNNQTTGTIITTGGQQLAAAQPTRTVYHNNPSFINDQYPTVPGTPEDDESNTTKQRPTSGQKINASSGLGSLQEESEPEPEPMTSGQNGRHVSTNSSLALPQRGFEVLSTSSGYGSGPDTPRVKSAPLQKSSSRDGLLRNQEPENYDSTSQQRPETQDTRLDGVASYQNMVQNGQLNAKDQNNKQSEKEMLGAEEEEEIEEPLDITWPNTCRKRVYFVLLAPIIFPLWLTLPDVRRPQSSRWYPITFVGSILWIAFFSYVMVWLAQTIGETAYIPTAIMGLTVLAAGTSIPDLITSVLVARKGLGDMAVSSSIGSNIFDVCMGLPIPWLTWFAVYSWSKPYEDLYISVLSKGLVCSVGMLFIMLIVLVLAIGLCHWQMSKSFGVIMIFAYLGFCVISVLLELEGYIDCPIRMEGSCVKWLPPSTFS